MTTDDRLYLDLKGARERLCRAQVAVKHPQERTWLQEALDNIDRVGVLEAPDLWSKFDEPPLSDGRQQTPAEAMQERCKCGCKQGSHAVNTTLMRCLSCERCESYSKATPDA